MQSNGGGASPAFLCTLLQLVQLRRLSPVNIGIRLALHLIVENVGSSQVLLAQCCSLSSQMTVFLALIGSSKDDYFVILRCKVGLRVN